MEAAGYLAFVESRPRIAGVLPALGYLVVVAVAWLLLPVAGFALALAGELFAFGALVVLLGERKREPYRDFGELPSYESGGVLDAWVITVAPEADDDRRTAVVRATRTFLFALLGGCIAVTFGLGRLVDTGLLTG